MAAPVRLFSVLRSHSVRYILKQHSERNVIRIGLCNGAILNHAKKIHCHCVHRQKNADGTANLKKKMESLTDKFAEARELLDDARESQGTVYFSDDMKEAQIAVEETLKEYRDLLDSLSDAQRQEVISTLGLRMEELKAQQAAIEEDLHD